MKESLKWGFMGFFIAFVGIWIILFITGHDDTGWKCSSIYGASYCSFFNFVFDPLHIAFTLFFSWIGFFGGIIDARLISKIISKKNWDKSLPLKITSIITLSLIAVFGFIGILAFENWVTILLYTITFTVFVFFISWVVGKIKYKN